MNICLIGSLRDLERIRELSHDLSERGHRVRTPVDVSEDRFADRAQAKHEFMKGMFEQIKNCETVLVVNDKERAGMEGYIGPNTFLQMGMAMTLGKPIFALSKWSDRLPYAEELNAMGVQQLDVKQAW